MDTHISYKRQRLAPEELRMVSQPPSFETIAQFQDYVYRSNPQREIFVYHVETGINHNHDDFRGRKVEWLFTRQARRKGQAAFGESSKTRPPGHSTCTASKATGSIFGAAKFATLVVVTMPDLSAASVSEVLEDVANDIQDKKRQYLSIINISWGSKESVLVKQYEFHTRMFFSIWHLSIDLHVPIVFSAGNDATLKDRFGRPRLRSDTFPAAATEQNAKTLSASNCDFRGRRWRTSGDQTGEWGFSEQFLRSGSRYQMCVSQLGSWVPDPYRNIFL
ncbi:MAG: hypothetical protein Q9184_005468 [Pyrenodesmia sp. 2 TL-2023]